MWHGATDQSTEIYSLVRDVVRKQNWICNLPYKIKKGNEEIKKKRKAAQHSMFSVLMATF